MQLALRIFSLNDRMISNESHLCTCHIYSLLIQSQTTERDQKKFDLAEAIRMTENLTMELEKMCQNSEEKFHKLFTVAEELVKEIGESLKIPSISKHQNFRKNYDTTSPKIYYRLSIFILFVDYSICHLKERFLKHKDVLTKIQNILPNLIVNLSENEINETIDIILAPWSEIINIIVIVL